MAEKVASVQNKHGEGGASAQRHRSDVQARGSFRRSPLWTQRRAAVTRGESQLRPRQALAWMAKATPSPPPLPAANQKAKLGLGWPSRPAWIGAQEEEEEEEAPVLARSEAPPRSPRKSFAACSPGDPQTSPGPAAPPPPYLPAYPGAAALSCRGRGRDGEGGRAANVLCLGNSGTRDAGRLSWLAASAGGGRARGDPSGYVARRRACDSPSRRPLQRSYCSPSLAPEPDGAHHARTQARRAAPDRKEREARRAPSRLDAEEGGKDAGSSRSPPVGRQEPPARGLAGARRRRRH